MAKKARKKTAAKKKKTKRSVKTRTSSKKKSRRVKAARARKPAARKTAKRKTPARKARPKPEPFSLTDKLSGAAQAVVDTVRETSALRDRLEPPGTSETQ